MEHKVAGNDAFKAGRLEEALDCFGRGAAACSSDAPQDVRLRAVCLNNRSIVFSKLDQPQRALDEVEKVVVLVPNWAKAHGRRASCLFVVGRVAEALRAYVRAIRVLDQKKQTPPDGTGAVDLNGDDLDAKTERAFLVNQYKSTLHAAMKSKVLCSPMPRSGDERGHPEELKDAAVVDSVYGGVEEVDTMDDLLVAVPTAFSVQAKLGKEAAHTELCKARMRKVEKVLKVAAKRKKLFVKELQKTVKVRTRRIRCNGVQILADAKEMPPVWVEQPVDLFQPKDGFVFGGITGCDSAMTLWDLPTLTSRWSRFARGLFTYYSLETPEVQWLRRRADWVLDQIRAGAADPSSTASRCAAQLLTLRIEMPVTIPGRGNFQRTFTVPGDISLGALSDRVLIPGIGFMRNYHGHVFQAMDGTAYGPEGGARSALLPEFVTGRTASVDAMFRHQYGHGVWVDEEKVRLCDVLGRRSPKEGKQLPLLRYTYDLGARWVFWVSVLKQEPRSMQRAVRLIQVVDGNLACPPEDVNGLKIRGGDVTLITAVNMAFCPKLDQPDGLNMQMDTFYSSHGAQISYVASICFGPLVQPGNKKYMEAHKEAMTSSNYQNQFQSGHHVTIIGKGGSDEDPPWDGTKWDPSHFSLADAQRRVRAALSSRKSNPEGGGGCPCCADDLWMKSTHRGVDDVCAYCGTAAASSAALPQLLLCAGCRSTRYCSPECQRADWKDGHRAVCKKRKKRAAARPVTSFIEVFLRRLVRENMMEISAVYDQAPLLTKITEMAFGDAVEDWPEAAQVRKKVLATMMK